ncbi:Photosystem II 10 kDa polypeptide, chloroplastic [Triticum urartu]|uniref:Photosystem II 10 kDa polypeptide, chloroplastic n=2 Tax=Triticum TaxID=4564 RepID=A0A9R0Y952_TRITD|nr:Photosystem II 10 kDa polypeptide, chloroplastic [Triticum urartu]VAI51096.1 unnamed protein product [Triticum turgidum subsp. durum]
MASLVLKPSPSPLLERAKLRGARPSARPSLLIVASKKAKKVQTAQPYGPGGGVVFKEGVDASGRVAKGKGVYQFADKYGANVDGYRDRPWSSALMASYSVLTTLQPDIYTRRMVSKW